MCERRCLKYIFIKRSRQRYQPKLDHVSLFIDQDTSPSWFLAPWGGKRRGRAAVLECIDPEGSSKCYQTICNLADRQTDRQTGKRHNSTVSYYYYRSFVEASRGASSLYINAQKLSVTVQHSLHGAISMAPIDRKQNRRERERERERSVLAKSDKVRSICFPPSHSIEASESEESEEEHVLV
jgi:hypothetical protein